MRRVTVLLTAMVAMIVLASGMGLSQQQEIATTGQAWAWGSNAFGQLGNGTTTSSNAPVQVSDLSGVQDVAAGRYHSLALKNDGTVWTWGDNAFGQLGDGTYTQRTTPVQVSGLSGVQAISANQADSLALKNDGTVWGWGDNWAGQLGNGTTTSSTNVPVQVSGLSGVQDVAAGTGHSLALKNDGTVWALGYNRFGQLGNGTTINSNTPVQVSDLSGVQDVAAGQLHGLALKNDGTVWAWGDNGGGQLGDSTYTQRTTPVQVSGLSGVQAIASGAYYSLALKNDGTVWTWGGNGFGQLGNGTTTNSNTPVQVSDLSGVQAIAGGLLSLALKNDGTLWAWGANNYGQLGDGTYTQRTTPVQVSALSGVQAISASYESSLAVASSDAAIDKTAPTVTSNVPKANATEVAPTANVRATFSEEMDSTTINGTTFQLFKKGTTTQIPAEVSYNADTDTAKLDPTNNLRRGVAYKAVVTTWAKDMAGNRLDQDDSTSGLQQMRWFFRVDD